MKGKNEFTESEIVRLKELIIKRCKSSSDKQKGIRAKMRKIGFYGKDDFGVKDMTIEKFENLIKRGVVKVIKDRTANSQKTHAMKKQVQVVSQNRVIVESFPPLVDENSEIIILGTIPGKESLLKNEYYASSRNSFWKIMSYLYNNKEELQNYGKKKECLKKHHIALWDVLSRCERDTSSDTNIVNEELNDMEVLLKEYTNIRRVICNGKQSFSYIKKAIENLNIDIEVAESTSSANTKMLEVKIENWKQCLDYEME